MSELKDPIFVRPAKNLSCAFETGMDPAGRRLTCPKKATIKVSHVPLCDQHAEYQMTSTCGCAVKIIRGQ